MATKHAGMGAALAVLAIVFGLLVMVGVILLMMWFQPGIEHSPAEHGILRGYFASPADPLPRLPMLKKFDQDTGVNT
jgi:hypothetical protein